PRAGGQDLRGREAAQGGRVGATDGPRPHDGAPRMSLQLLVLSGPDRDRVIAIQAGADLLVGRGQTSFYRLNDPRVSRTHCQLLLEGDQVTAVCQGGSGGTFVNGQKVTRQ